jgi:hypothetical protein
MVKKKQTLAETDEREVEEVNCFRDAFAGARKRIKVKTFQEPDTGGCILTQIRREQ